MRWSRTKTKRILKELAGLYESSGHAEDAERARRDATDAGLYLHELAELEGRTVDVVATAERIRTAAEADGRWAEEYEWRIGTAGTDAIEVLPGRGFRALVDHHGTFEAGFATFAEAYEAMRVLSQIQKDLFYAVGWNAWADCGRLTERDPPRRRREEDERLAYLYRLSQEARAESIPERAFTRSTRPWGDDGEDVPVFEFDVRERSFSMRGVSPTLERASEFAGIYERLRADLELILEWKWL